MPTGTDPIGSRIRASVLSTSPIARIGIRGLRIGIRGLLATVPSRITLVADTDVDHVPAADVTILDVAALNDTEHHRSVARAMVRSNAVVAIATGFHPSQPTHLEALGVETCVSPDISAADLVATIESAVSDRARRGVGLRPQDPSVTPPKRRTPSLCRGTEASFAAGLSTREHHIIAKIAEGLSNQAIADELFLSINSIKSYIRSAYSKMGVQTRSEGIVWAFREGISYTPVDEAGRPPAVGS